MVLRAGDADWFASLHVVMAPDLEQWVMTTLHESRSSHCCQRPPHTFRRQKPFWHESTLISGCRRVQGLWVSFEGLCQAKGALSGAAPTRWYVEYVYWCWLSCFVPWFSFKGTIWLMQAQPRWQLPCIFVNIRRPGPWYKRRDDKKNTVSLLLFTPVQDTPSL